MFPPGFPSTSLTPPPLFSLQIYLPLHPCFVWIALPSSRNYFSLTRFSRGPPDHWRREWHLTRVRLMSASPEEFWHWNRGWARTRTETDEPTSFWVLDLSCKVQHCQKLGLLIDGLEKHRKLVWRGKKKRRERRQGRDNKRSFPTPLTLPAYLHPDC